MAFGEDRVREIGFDLLKALPHVQGVAFDPHRAEYILDYPPELGVAQMRVSEKELHRAVSDNNLNEFVDKIEHYRRYGQATGRPPQVDKEKEAYERGYQEGWDECEKDLERVRMDVVHEVARCLSLAKRDGVAVTLSVMRLSKHFEDLISKEDFWERCGYSRMELDKITDLEESLEKRIRKGAELPSADAKTDRFPHQGKGNIAIDA